MRWLLAGYCGLALISISVCLKAQDIHQAPRYADAPIRKFVTISCTWPTQHVNATAVWYKAQKYKDHKERIQIGGRTNVMEGSGYSVVVLSDLQKDDSGVYYCLVHGAWGSGTGIHVGSPVNYDKAQWRTQMKDILIVLQGLLVAMCVGASLLRQQKLQQEKNDYTYEEPENDHIYEGLMIETCSGGLYEDLSVYAQPEGAEAPWE